MGDIIKFAPKAVAKPIRATNRPVDFRPFIRCRDIAGRCCDSCHDEADGGGTPLIALFGDHHMVVGLVCCHKLGEAKLRQKRPPVQRSASLSTLSGECYR